MIYNFNDHIKGDTFLGTEFEVSDGTGAPIDLTDYRIRMHLRREASRHAVRVHSFDTEDGTIEIHDPTAGKFRIIEQVIDIPAFSYVYDMEFTSVAGRVRTWIKGVFPVKEEVTYGS